MRELSALFLTLVVVGPDRKPDEPIVIGTIFMFYPLPHFVM